MSLLVVIAGLLLAGALGLLYFPWSGKGAVDRDALNRALYQSRLQELAQERGEDNPALVVELQRTLLTDIPPQAQPGERPLRRWALLPGALLLVVLSLGLYMKTSDIGQVLLWQQAERHFPALLQQVKDPTAAPLRMDELAELRLGLRSHLQDTPNDLAGWQLLGRLGLLLNDGETAIGAFGRAHALAADDPAAAFDYASALVRAGDSGQVRMGELLLRDLHQRQRNSLPVLEMLALSACVMKITRGRGGPAGVAGPATGRGCAARGDRPPAGASAAAGTITARRRCAGAGLGMPPEEFCRPGKAQPPPGTKSAPCPLSLPGGATLARAYEGRESSAKSRVAFVGRVRRQPPPGNILGTEPDFLPAVVETIIGFLVLSPGKRFSRVTSAYSVLPLRGAMEFYMF